MCVCVCHSDTDWGRLVARRQNMATVPVADVEAVRRSLWAARPRYQAAALRTVVLGGAVPQAVAALRTGTDGRPHCGVAETLWHRMWDCPRWACRARPAARRSVARLP